jgi:hypothetical protein
VFSNTTYTAAAISRIIVLEHLIFFSVAQDLPRNVELYDCYIRTRHMSQLRLVQRSVRIFVNIRINIPFNV